MKSFLHRKEWSVFIGIIVFSLLIGLRNPDYLAAGNIFDIVNGSAVLGIMALGMLIVLLSGGIDLSVGATMYLVTVMISYTLQLSGGNVALAFLCACVLGGVVGMINGVLISQLNASPLVVTLAMASVMRGAVKSFADKSWFSGLPKSFIEFGNMTVVRGISIQLCFLILTILLTVVFLKYSRTGRGIYALGEDRTIAVRVGYNVKRLKTVIYTFCGLMAGIAGFVHTSLMKQVDPNGFAGYEFSVIAAVILGGASVMGGSGSVWGTFLGVCFFQIINNGLVMAHIPVFWQDIAVGFIVVLMVSYDVIKKKAFQRKVSEKVAH